MTNREIGKKLEQLIRNERKANLELLLLISQGIQSRAYLEHGFPSMYEWLVRGFGYSHSAAFRRIQASKMVNLVPEAATKLKIGATNLTNLSRAHSIIKAQERACGEKIPVEKQRGALARIEKTSEREAQKALLELFPQAGLLVHRERTIVVDAQNIRISMNLPTEASRDLQRAKEILSHQFPSGASSEIFGYVLRFFLARADPLRTPPAGPDKRRVKSMKHLACTFHDPVSGRVCGSRYQVQVDHIKPKSMGGQDVTSNLRPLCRQHNLYMAEQMLGREAIEPFRK